MADPISTDILRSLETSGAGASGTVWIGFSGGLDSSVLLVAAAVALPGRVRAVHVHHGLSPNADLWAQHCLAVAARWQVPCEVVKVEVKAAGEGLEAAARRARYRAFEQCLAVDEVLLTGHHANDQAETMGLRLARGAGLEGLAGIAARRRLGRGWVARPLLQRDRAELEHFATTRQLLWIEDESNSDLRYARNQWRHKVLPVITAEAPHFARHCARAAQHLQTAATLLDEYAALDLMQLAPRAERLGQSVALAPLAGFSPARQRAVLRHWLARRFDLRVSEVRLAALIETLAGANDSNADWRVGDWHFRRYQQRLHAVPAATLSSPTPLVLDWKPAPDTVVTLADGSCLRAHAASAGLPADLHYRICPRQPGTRAQPSGRAHSQALKKLLQEAGLAPWLRDRAPLLYHGDELAAVADLWVETRYFTRARPAVVLEWYFPGLPPSGRD